jgi:hypothetical protein
MNSRDLIPPFQAVPWSEENELLTQIAEFAFANNLKREGDRYYDFNPKELHDMTGMCQGENNWTYKKSGVLVGRYLRKYLGYSVYNSGWVFLDDDDDGFGGCIRLFPKCSNNGYRSKYSFWKDEEGKIQIGNA